MECPNCRYVTTPGQASVEGSCPKCGHQPELDQISPTKTDFQAFGMPDPGEDDGNQGNPLAEGSIMGSDGEKPPLKRDNWMSKRTEIFPPLGFTAKEDDDEDEDDEKYIPASDVDVIKEEDLPDERKDRDLDSVKQGANQIPITPGAAEQNARLYDKLKEYQRQVDPAELYDNPKDQELAQGLTDQSFMNQRGQMVPRDRAQIQPMTPEEEEEHYREKYPEEYIQQLRDRGFSDPEGMMERLQGTSPDEYQDWVRQTWGLKNPQERADALKQRFVDDEQMTPEEYESQLDQHIQPYQHRPVEEMPWPRAGAFGDENDAGNTAIPVESEDGDSQQHPDGDRQLGLQVGDDVGGSPDQGWSDHAAQQISDRLPQILQHAFSEEPTGDLEDLHQLLSSERPGYDQEEDDQGAMNFIVAGMGGDPDDPGEWEDGEHNGYDPMDQTPHDEAVTSAIVIEANIFGSIGNFIGKHALDIASVGAMAIPGVGEAALAARAGLTAAKAAGAVGGIGKIMGAARTAGGLAAKAWNSPALKWPKRMMMANHLINGSPGLLGGGGMGQQPGGMQQPGGGGMVNAPSYYSHHEALAEAHRLSLMQPGLQQPGQTTLTPEDVEEQAQSFQGRCPSCGATMTPGQPCPQCGMGSGSTLGTDPTQQLTAAFFGPGKSVGEGIPEPPSASQFQTADIPPNMTIQEWNQQGRPVHCDSCQNPTVDRQTGQCSNCGTVKPGYQQPPEYERTANDIRCPYCRDAGCPECTDPGSLNLDDPRDDAMRETWGLLNGTADGASNFIRQRQQLRDIRNLPERTGANTQGPNTDEQKAAVAELLQQENRSDEIPQMILDPSQYADELAKVIGQEPPPEPVDPSQQTPPPAVDPSAMQGQGMPPGMPPMGPGGGAPMGAMARAIHKYADDMGAEEAINAARALAEEHAEGNDHIQNCPKCGGGVASIRDQIPPNFCTDCGHRYWDKDLTLPSEVPADWNRPQLEEQFAQPSGLQWDDPRNSHTAAEDHVQKHHDNFDNTLDVPAADRVRPEDREREQDSGHTWADESGQPLVVGQEYEMYSNKYDVPDMVRIEDVKPDAIQYTLTGEYGLDHSTEVKYEEAQLEDLAFVPVAAGHPEEAQPGEDQNAEDLGLADPGAEQSDLSTPSNDGFNQPLLSNTHEAMTARDFRLIADAIASAPVTERQALAEHFAEQLASTNPRFDKERFIQAAIGQPGGRDVRNVNRDYPPDNQPGDLTVPQEWTANTNREWLKEGGANFTPVEQREFIDEAGVARNADKLDLSGTHYESHVEVDSDYFLFGQP